jgi:3,4-dihydroxy 2-butanone 4-phosphate synthase/GTP cyclohydrolase II
MLDATPNDPLLDWLDSQTAPSTRPWVSLTYAQSLDGSLAGPGGVRLELSGPDSLRLTHRLRAWHDSLLVGIGTALADDPSLTVRRVAGASPRPVILDSQLRLPLTARLLHAGQRPLIFASEAAPPERAERLRAAGAEVVCVASAPTGGLDLRQVLAALQQLGMQRLMVEGGSRVLHAMLAQRLGDCLIVTVAPRLVAGTPVLGLPGPDGTTWPALVEPHWSQAGQDAILWARLEGPQP